MHKETYELIDSGQGRKLERFGSYILSRPCSQAVWKKSQPEEVWHKADAIFTRDEENRWMVKNKLPMHWAIDIDGLVLKINPTDFGHLGVFPEQRVMWSWMRKVVALEKNVRKTPPKVLNLFAYSGAATLSCALAGAEVCHVDASKGMVAWARENASLNNLEQAPIRWIIDDVMKFLKREIKRQSFYDLIILDPPTFGRGAKGELFKIEEAIFPLLEACKEVLSKNPIAILLSCHTPGFTPIVLQNILSQTCKFPFKEVEAEEMIIHPASSLPLPCGSFARWQKGHVK